MTRSWRVVAVLAVLAAMMVALAACGDDDEAGTTGTATTQTAANAEVCSSAARLRTVLGEIGDLEPGNVTRDQLTGLAADVGTAWADLRAALSSARDVDSSAVTEAWDETRAAIAGFGSGKSPEEVATDVRETLPALREALEGVAPGCEEGTSTGAAPAPTTP